VSVKASQIEFGAIPMIYMIYLKEIESIPLVSERGESGFVARAASAAGSDFLSD